MKPTLQNNIEEAKKRFELFTQDYEDVFNQYVCCSGGIKGDVDCACNGLLWKDKIEDYLISELTSIATLAQEEARKEMQSKVMEIYSKKYSHITREYRDTDQFRDEILKALLSTISEETI